jgi:SAM-dependent methyltransferase
MATAPDGSPVELYAMLPPLGEGDRVAQALPPPAGVLELGAGTGRITRQLTALGYSVTAVDESAAMLAHVEGAELVCAQIEQLRLERRFDAVLLASNLITAEPPQRRAFLETCRRHSDLVIIEGLALGWQPNGGETRLGDVHSQLRVARVAGGVVHGEVRYRAGPLRWTHAFSMRVFADRAELDAALAEAGLRFDRWLDGDRGRWLVAVAC